jgi:hypothetical protein
MLHPSHSSNMSASLQDETLSATTCSLQRGVGRNNLLKNSIIMLITDFYDIYIYIYIYIDIYIFFFFLLNHRQPDITSCKG